MLRKISYFLFIYIFTFVSAESIVGKIHSVSGDVAIYSSHKANSVRKAIIGRSIYEGDRLSTSENGICQVLYENEDAFIRLENNTKVKFSSAGYSDIIDLMSGKVYCQKAENNRSLKVFTSTGQYNSDNGRFWLSSKLNKNDEILVHTGEVHLNNQYSLSDIILKMGEAGVSHTNGEVYVGSYNSVELISLQQQTKMIEDFIEPVILRKDMPKIYSSDLIPQYKSQSLNFSKNVQSFRDYRYQFGNHATGERFLQIVPYFHRFDFKIGFSIPVFFGQNGFRTSDWNDAFDLIDRINYLDYNNNLKRFEIHIGKIENKTWGAGGLLYKYRNTQNYPSKVRTGFEFSKSYGKRFVNLNLFISSIRDLAEGGGGLMGIRSEMFLTESFPLTIGLGFLADFNNYSEYSDLITFKTRSVSGMALDFNYKLVSGINNYIDIYFEYDEIYYNEKVIFTSPGKDIIEKPGTTNWILGTEIKRGSIISNLDFELSAKTMNSQFFNSLYDLEKARYISIHNDSITNSNSRLNDLNNYSLNHNTNATDSSLQQYLIPKDIYPIYANQLNFYDTPGVRFSVKKYFGNYGHFKLGYGLKIEKKDSQYFKILESGSLTDEQLVDFKYDSKKYHSLEINAGFGNNIINGISGFDFFYQQYNAPSFFSFSDTSTSAEMGFNISLKPMQFTRLIIESKMIHFDNNSDGIIDKSNNLNIEIKFSI